MSYWPLAVRSYANRKSRGLLLASGHDNITHAVPKLHNLTRESRNGGVAPRAGFFFLNCLRFYQPLNDWNVSNVTDMYSMFRGTESFNLTRTVKYVVNPGAPNDIPEMVEVTAYNLVYPANVEECVQACKNLELEIIETWSTEAAENRRQYPFTEFIYRHDSTCECFSSAEIEDGGHYPAYVTNENTDYTSGLIQPKAGDLVHNRHIGHVPLVERLVKRFRI